MSKSTSKKNLMSTSVIFFSLFSIFLLSDFYYQGLGRPFDYIAIILFFLLYIIRTNYFWSGGIFLKSGVLVAIVFPWILFGALLNESILLACAMILGAGLLFPISYDLFNRNLLQIIQKQIYLLILINSLVLFAQFGTYSNSGYFIDLPSLFGATESRGLNEGLNYFRPSGLFQEPNAFCTVMFCLISACSFFKNRNVYIEITGLSSIVLTQSLWGFGAVLVLVWLLYGVRWLVILSVVFSFLAFSFLFFTENSLRDLAGTSVTMDRILNIDKDPSAEGRFGRFENLRFNILFLLGHGIDSNNFQSIAANGLIFLFYCFGFAGVFIIFLYFLFLTRMNFRILFILGFLFTTFPVFSYMFFWVWLAIILVFNQSENFHSQ